MLLSPMRGEDPESPSLPKELDPSDLKLQETFLVNFTYYFCLTKYHSLQP